MYEADHIHPLKKISWIWKKRVRQHPFLDFVNKVNRPSKISHLSTSFWKKHLHFFDQINWYSNSYSNTRSNKLLIFTYLSIITYASLENLPWTDRQTFPPAITMSIYRALVRFTCHHQKKTHHFRRVEQKWCLNCRPPNFETLVKPVTTLENEHGTPKKKMMEDEKLPFPGRWLNQGSFRRERFLGSFHWSPIFLGEGLVIWGSKRLIRTLLLSTLSTHGENHQKKTAGEVVKQTFAVTKLLKNEMQQKTAWNLNRKKEQQLQVKRFFFLMLSQARTLCKFCFKGKNEFFTDLHRSLQGPKIPGPNFRVHHMLSVGSASQASFWPNRNQSPVFFCEKTY